MNRRLRLSIATVGLAVMALLAGCSQISSGVVHDRHYSPGYMTVSYCGKGCVLPIYEPPSWSLDLYQSASQHGWREVDEHEYNACSVGERFPECADTSR